MRSFLMYVLSYYFQYHQCWLLCGGVPNCIWSLSGKSQSCTVDGVNSVWNHPIFSWRIHPPQSFACMCHWWTIIELDCILNNIYSKNSIDYRFLLLTSLQVKDAGGSMIIHAFGGYYGLTISWVLHRSNLGQSKRLHGSVYHSDVFAMIGEKICFFQTQNFYKHMIWC